MFAMKKFLKHIVAALAVAGAPLPSQADGSYTITIAEAQNCTVAIAPQKESYAEGDNITVTLTANPDCSFQEDGFEVYYECSEAEYWETLSASTRRRAPQAPRRASAFGYRLKIWNLSGHEDEAVEVAAGKTYTLTMPARNVEVEAYFNTNTTLYAVQATQQSNGTTTVSTSQAKAGQTVSITATPESGYCVDEVKVFKRIVASSMVLEDEMAYTRVDATHFSFTMPANPVRIEVSYKVAPPLPAAGFYRLRAADGRFLAQNAAGQPVLVAAEAAKYDASTIYIILYDATSGNVTLSSQARFLCAEGFSSTAQDVSLQMTNELEGQLAEGNAVLSVEGNAAWTFVANPTLKVRLNTVGDVGFATGYYPFAVSVNDAYAATVKAMPNQGKAFFAATPTNLMPALTGMLLVGEELEATLTPTAETVAAVSTDLQGHLLAGSVANALVLNAIDNTPGFYALKSGATLAANRAYLEYTGASIRGLILTPAPTGIANVEEGNATPSDHSYDLQGRRVATNTRAGIYILNGKKVLVK